jgi:hypothetical protein
LLPPTKPKMTPGLPSGGESSKVALMSPSVVIVGHVDVAARFVGREGADPELPGERGDVVLGRADERGAAL